MLLRRQSKVSYVSTGSYDDGHVSFNSVFTFDFFECFFFFLLFHFVFFVQCIYILFNSIQFFFNSVSSFYFSSAFILVSLHFRSSFSSVQFGMFSSKFVDFIYPSSSTTSSSTYDYVSSIKIIRLCAYVRNSTFISETSCAL